jgi:hypothetical protein
MFFEYEAAWPKLKIGGVLVSDDVNRNSAFEDFCKAKQERGQVVGGKGLVFKSHQ